MPLNTGNDFIDALGGNPWPRVPNNTSSTGELILTVYLDNAGTGGAWTTEEDKSLSYAFKAWQDVANIVFLGVDNSAAANLVEFKGTSADEQLSDPNGYVYGSHQFPQNAANGHSVGVFNTSLDNGVNYWTSAGISPGGIVLETFIHELGHALGLAHPHDDEMGTGVFPGVRPPVHNPDGSTTTFDGDPGNNGFNNVLYSIMSYNEPDDSTLGSTTNEGFAASPMAFDIAAVQQLYGARAAHTGNTTYVISDGTLFVSCIWDTEGYDTIRYDGVNDATIDLRSATLRDELGGGGYLSSPTGLVRGYTVAGDFTNFINDEGTETGVIMEAATGGSGNDKLTGNGVANKLDGGDGNDNLDGGGSNDELIGGRGNDTLDGGQGVDTMNGGAGNDESYVDSSSDKVYDYFSAVGLGPIDAGGVDTVISRAATYTLLSAASRFGQIENLRYEGNEGFTGTGNALNNTITGGDYNDTLYGGAGNDILSGGDGNDTLLGQANDDHLSGGKGDDTLFGASGNDYLEGNAGADILYGGMNDDVYILWDGDFEDVALEYRSSTLHLDAGGIDEIRTDRALFALEENARSKIENLTYLGFGNFEGFGNSLNNVIRGGTGTDLLVGGAGNDTLFGEFRRDVLRGGLGNDKLYGGEGNDELAGGENNDRLEGGIGNDDLYGDAGDDQLYGDAGYDTLYGGAGNDRLDAGLDDDGSTLAGGLGNDTYIVWKGSEVIVEIDGEGTDKAQVVAFGYTLAANVENMEVVSYGGSQLAYGNELHNIMTTQTVFLGSEPYGQFTLYGAGGNDTITGGDFAMTGDLLDGGQGNDKVYGRSGTDTLRGGTGNDLLDGGAGNDTADYSLATSGITVNMTLAIEGLGGEAAGDNFISIENVTGSDFTDNLIGNAGANILSGGKSGDFLTGNGGKDVLDGGDGDDIFVVDNLDTLQGGEGYDTASADASTVAAGWKFKAAGSGIEKLIGNNGNDVLNGAGVAYALNISGGAGRDTLTGGEANDDLQGGLGNDTLLGGAGNDILDGGAGVDTLDGGVGDDIILTDNFNVDIIRGGEGFDQVYASAATAAAGFKFTLTAEMSIEGIAGSNGKDVLDASAMTTAVYLVGFDGDDILTGGSGDDNMIGDAYFFSPAGNDIMYGGAGSDHMYGYNGDDIIYGGGSSATLGLGDYLLGGTGNDTLYGGGNGSLGGEEGDDTLNALSGDFASGGAGNDTITGSGGTQEIDGGAGNDTLTGGADLDYFDFQDGWGADTITDFEIGIDKLNLQNVTGLNVFADLSINDIAGGAEITFAGQSILLSGIAATAVTQDQFIL